MTPFRRALLTASAALRAAVGRSSRSSRSRARPINYLATLLFHLPPGAPGTAIGTGIFRPRGAPPPPPISAWTRSSRQSLPAGARGMRARGGSDGGGRGRACPMKAGHDGFACASCTDFFGLFLLACRLASARVLVCRMGMSSDRGTLTVTVYGRLSWRMCSTHHKGCLRLRARVGTDQDDL